MASMRIAVLAFGTRGDIQPLIVLGDELQRRGHSVAMTLNEDLVEWAGRSGIEIVPIQHDVGAFMRSDEAQGFLASGKILKFLKAAGPVERRANRSIIDACIAAGEGADLVISTHLTRHRGECLTRAFGVRHGCAYTLPTLPTGHQASPLSPVPDLRLNWLNRASWRLLHWAFWRDHRANIDEMCDALGIARFKRRPRIEMTPSVSLYSPGSSRGRRSGTSGTRSSAGPAMSKDLRARLGEGVPSDLAEWLDAGDPPVFFGFGSMPILDIRAMLRDVARVTAERGLRGLIGAGWTEFGESAESLPDHLHIAADFDHDAILPRCRAAVHHGGSGTTAAVLRAGHSVGDH